MRNPTPSDVTLPDDVTPLDEVTPLDPNSETAIATARKERALRQDLERKLTQLQKTYADINPDVARRAQEVLDQSERQQEQSSKWEAEIEARFKLQYEPLVAQLQADAKVANQRHLDYCRDVQLERAFYECDGLAGEFEPCSLALKRRIAVKEDGEIVVLKADGKTPDFVASPDGARAKSVADLIEELKQSKDHAWFARHFKGTERGGFGITGDSAIYANDPAYAQLQPWQRLDMDRAKKSNSRRGS